jgi:hypothetical protein
MDWFLNFLIKLLGGFLTAGAILGIRMNSSTGWIIGSLSIGLALLFSPKLGAK